MIQSSEAALRNIFDKFLKISKKTSDCKKMDVLKSQIEELQQSLIKDKEPEFGFTDTSNIESVPLLDNDYEELKNQHQRDINEVQNILDQLKDLVEE